MQNTIEVAGIQQRYHVHGTGPVLVAHSGGPGIGWEYLRMPLVEQHRTVVYVEPIGTGESGRLPDPAQYIRETYVRFLHAIVEHLGAPTVSVLGHSHGGFVALEYALTHPETVDGLILHDTSPVTGAEFWQSAVENMTKFVRDNEGKPGVDAILPAFTANHAELTDEQTTDTIRTILPAYLADYWGREAVYLPMRAQISAWSGPSRGQEPNPFDLRARLGEIAVPTLVAVGTHDFICGPTWARMLADGIPGAVYAEFANSGHMPHIEEPAEFDAAIRKVLA
ncbi:MAG TPA: alpha/beta fold hydrolase [Pseudonocardiaceae bacterium]